jgi:subtilase family serine protease
MTDQDLYSFNIEALKLSSMGVTIIAASGDDGAPNFDSAKKTCKCTEDSSRFGS